MNKVRVEQVPGMVVRASVVVTAAVEEGSGWRETRIVFKLNIKAALNANIYIYF